MPWKKLLTFSDSWCDANDGNVADDATRCTVRVTVTVTVTVTVKFDKEKV